MMKKNSTGSVFYGVGAFAVCFVFCQNVTVLGGAVKELNTAVAFLK